MKIESSVTPFLGIKDACRVTGLSQWYLRKRVSDNTIPHIMTGSKILINVPALMEILDRESKKDVSA